MYTFIYAFGGYSRVVNGERSDPFTPPGRCPAPLCSPSGGIKPAGVIYANLGKTHLDLQL